MTWYPGYEQKYNRFLDNGMVHSLAVPYTVYARDEMLDKPGPVGVVEVPYYDIGTLFLRVRPIFPPIPPTGHSERRTKVQVGGG